MEKVIMDEKWGKTTFDDTLKLVKIVWGVDCNSENYRSSYIKIIEFQRTTPADFFISDIREQPIISPEDRKWFEKEIIPKAIKQGLKKAVVISTGSAFKKYYLNLILSTTNKFGLPLKIFSDEEEALKWLTGKI
jgi:hypothetical protein